MHLLDPMSFKQSQIVHFHFPDASGAFNPAAPQLNEGVRAVEVTGALKTREALPELAVDVGLGVSQTSHLVDSALLVREHTLQVHDPSEVPNFNPDAAQSKDAILATGATGPLGAAMKEKTGSESCDTSVAAV